MKISIISFTGQGLSLSKKIAQQLEKNAEQLKKSVTQPREVDYELFTKCSAARKQSVVMPGIQIVEDSVCEWARQQFDERNAMLFIGACGIAVRAVAPHLTDKLHDSPVLVMDEKGRYVIPILAGHAGGANALAAFLAGTTGAEAVITTATDLNQKFAADLFAARQGLAIVNKAGIAKVSAKVLAGERITMSIETGHVKQEGALPDGVELTAYPPVHRTDIVVTSENRESDATLLLMPKKYVIGFGCKKGKEAEEIEGFVMRSLQKAGIPLMLVCGLASIDRKKEEPGLLAWSRKERLPFLTFPAEELKCVEGAFQKSEFVETQVGVDNVCERAALKMCGPTGRLVYEKHAEDGMTIAIAEKEWCVGFGEDEA